MNRRLFQILLGVAFLFGAGDLAYADNDQNIVLGIGLGLHSFSQSDDFREPSGPFTVEIDVAGMSQLYAEWYALGALGFGVRVVTLSVREEVSTIGGSTAGHKELTVSNVLGTVNLVLLGGTSYARLGVMAGAGSSTYEATESFSGSTASDSTSGTAALAGAYVDWGGADAGGRFGVNVLSTQLDKLGGFDVDASGTSVYFDFRWAFK